MQDQRTCRHCGRPIEGRAAQARYCSRRCRADAKNVQQRAKIDRTPVLKTCARCGTSFQAENRVRHKRFCSTRCRESSRRKRRTGQPGRAYLNGGYNAVLYRDPCAYCGGPSDVLDHIEPWSRGGSDHWTNYTAACTTCNNVKRTLPLIFAVLAMRITAEIQPELQTLARIRDRDSKVINA